MLARASVRYLVLRSDGIGGDASVYPPEMDIRTGSKPVPGQSFTVSSHISFEGSNFCRKKTTGAYQDFYGSNLEGACPTLDNS